MMNRKSLWGVVLCWAGYISPATAACTLTKEFVFDHAEIGAVQISRDTNANAIAFTSQMQVMMRRIPTSANYPNILEKMRRALAHQGTIRLGAVRTKDNPLVGLSPNTPKFAYRESHLSPTLSCSLR